MVEIEKPRIECIDSQDDVSYGKYIVEPLERGYGTTLGNSLRRILLSSLPGTAATSIKIAGVQHEFSTVPGVKEDAEKEGAELLQPTTDTVTYSDGLSDEVFGFDIPVPTLDEEFDLALIGKKGTWYDHKVSVSNPVPVEESGKTVDDLALADGTYTDAVHGTVFTAADGILTATLAPETSYVIK